MMQYQPPYGIRDIMHMEPNPPHHEGLFPTHIQTIECGTCHTIEAHMNIVKYGKPLPLMYYEHIKRPCCDECIKESLLNNSRSRAAGLRFYTI